MEFKVFFCSGGLNIIRVYEVLSVKLIRQSHTIFARIFCVCFPQGHNQMILHVTHFQRSHIVWHLRLTLTALYKPQLELTSFLFLYPFVRLTHTTYEAYAIKSSVDMIAIEVTICANVQAHTIILSLARSFRRGDRNKNSIFIAIPTIDVILFKCSIVVAAAVLAVVAFCHLLQVTGIHTYTHT